MHHSLKNRTTAIALLLVVIASPGCFWSGELAGVRRDIEAQLPGSTFHKNVELSLGPIVLGLAKLVTAVVPGASEARPWLSGISRVQIGVYEANVDSMSLLRTPRRLASLLENGWETAVRVREADEAVWILYRPDGDSVREVFVVVLGRDELVMVRAKGRLDRLVDAAMREPGGLRGLGLGHRNG